MAHSAGKFKEFAYGINRGYASNENVLGRQCLSSLPEQQQRGGLLKA